MSGREDEPMGNLLDQLHSGPSPETFATAVRRSSVNAVSATRRAKRGPLPLHMDAGFVHRGQIWGLGRLKADGQMNPLTSADASRVLLALALKALVRACRHAILERSTILRRLAERRRARRNRPTPTWRW